MESKFDWFELILTVAPIDIDLQGHVNNVTYVRWIQDAAVAHWRALAPGADQDSLRWVVLRHEIDYKRPAMLEDRILARTRVGSATRLRFDRHTEILRQHDSTLLACARTVWCPIDAQTNKPTNVRPEIRALFSR
jgi:acyl-CoA thioester hydrolase